MRPPAPRYLEAGPSRSTSIDVFLGRLHETEVAKAIEIADQIYDPVKPIAETVVIIPVALPHDAHLISHAVEQYERQDTKNPFTLILGLNSDRKVTADRRAFADIHQELILQAKRAFPHLDVRASLLDYKSPTIAEIRSDLWNGVLLAGQRQVTAATGDMPKIGLNHDIDVMRLPRGYIAAVQRHYRLGAHIEFPAYTMTRHGFDPKHPNTSKYIRWEDFWYHQFDGSYEAGAVVPFSYYARHGGLNRLAVINEFNALIGSNGPNEPIATGFLVTSPRRIVARMPQHGRGAIWAKGSFSSSDSCRNPEIVTQISDMPSEDVMRILTETLPTNFQEKLYKILWARVEDIRYELTGDGLKETERKAIQGHLEAYLTVKAGYLQRLVELVIQSCVPDGAEIPDVKKLIAPLDIPLIVANKVARSL